MTVTFTDEELAEIFYILVHDYDTHIISDIIGQNHEGKTTYRDIILKIKTWSEEHGFYVIKNRSINILSEIR